MVIDCARRMEERGGLREKGQCEARGGDKNENGGDETERRGRVSRKPAQVGESHRRRRVLRDWSKAA